MNSVVPVMVHRKPVIKNLLNSLSVNANPALRVIADTEVAELHALDSFLGIDLVSIWTYTKGRLAMIVFIEVSGRPSPFDTNILPTWDKGLAQLVCSVSDLSDPACFGHCIEGFLQVLVVGRSNDSRLGGKNGN